MEVVHVKKILAQNLFIYIGLHCVRRSSWTVTTLATLILNVLLLSYYKLLDQLQGVSVCNSTTSKQHKPPIYLYSIFAFLQFEISNLMNWIFILFQTWILQATGGKKIQLKLERKKIQFIRLDISNLRIAKNKCR